MEIFISWSGQASRVAATALRAMLASIFGNRFSVWFSDTDIAKGVRWSPQVFEALDRTQVGMVCVTRSNRTSPWLLFEAGALAKNVDRSRMFPILFDLTPAEMDGPLAQFQLTQVTKHDFRALIEQINKLTATPHSPKRLNQLIEAHWPKFKRTLTRLGRIPEAGPTNAVEAELLKVLRKMTTYKDFSALLQPAPFKELKGGKRRRPKKTFLDQN